MLNGEGLRTVLWVAGCSHHCPQCHNPVTWDINGGLVFDEQAKEELFEELKKDVIAYMDDVYPDKNITFKVESRRAKKTYPKKSMEINYDLGEAILYAFPEIRVDVHHPDVLLHVEVRDEIYIYSEIIPGPGCMAIGTN